MFDYDNEEFYNPLTVEALEPYEELNIILTFEDNPGLKKVYNMQDDLNKHDFFDPFLDPEFFKKVTCEECCGVEWDDAIGVSPEDLYFFSIPFDEWQKQQKNPNREERYKFDIPYKEWLEQQK